MTDPADDRRGDTWGHVAIDAGGRLVIGVVTGERTAEGVVAVVNDFKRRTGGRSMGLMTTDGYLAYGGATLEAYGRRSRRPGPASEDVPRPLTRSRRRA